MFNPDGCFCCNPPEDPCTLSGCTWSSTDMSDTDLTDGVAYRNAVSGTTPDGTYEITNAQETGTGNDAPCRKITISTTTAPHKPDTIYAICWKDNATHNPATQCPLTSVSFCVESKRHSDSDSGLSDSVVFVVRQGGKIYATATNPVGVNWKRASGVYTSGQFNWINGTGNPNFSASGSSIEFGFALKLSVSEDEEPVDIVMFDNLCITRPVECVCNIPNCDVYSTDPEAGTVSSQCSADPLTITTGTQAKADGGNEAFINIDWGEMSPHSAVNLGIDSGIEVDFSAGCSEVSSVSVCVRIRADSDISGTCLGTFGACRLANIGVIVRQNGEFYHTNTGAATLDRGVSVVRTIVITKNVYRITNLPSSPIYGGPPGVSNNCYPNVADTIDLNAPFEIVLFGNANAYVSTTSGVEYIKSTKIAYDNICVKAVYGACTNGCCPDDMLVTYSGDIWSETGACANDWAAVNSHLSSGVVITKGVGTISNGFSTSLSKWGYYYTFPSIYNAANTIHISVWAEMAANSGLCILRLYTSVAKTGPGIATISQGMDLRYWNIVSSGSNYWKECVDGGTVSAVSNFGSSAQSSNNSGCNPQYAGTTVTVIDV